MNKLMGGKTGDLIIIGVVAFIGIKYMGMFKPKASQKQTI
jgi:hypothetical protein